jgi:hypothetical protein
LDVRAAGCPWPLSKRAAAGALHISPTQALRLLRILIEDDVLVRVSEGQRGTRPTNGKPYLEAATYRFVGDR